ncbi:hypothetical protein PENTCL1PPCAC_20075, partial [Pristionchus entomophagus]
FDEFSRMGPRRAGHSGESVRRLTDKIDRLVEEAKKRVDLNLIFVSLHGIVEVPPTNETNEFVKSSVNYATISPSQMSRYISRPLKLDQGNYHSNEEEYEEVWVGDLPDYYSLKLSPIKDETKRFPSGIQNKPMGKAGFNGRHPDMLGLFMAYGP